MVLCTLIVVYSHACGLTYRIFNVQQALEKVRPLDSNQGPLTLLAALEDEDTIDGESEEDQSSYYDARESFARKRLPNRNEKNSFLIP